MTVKQFLRDTLILAFVMGSLIFLRVLAPVVLGVGQ